MVMHTPSDVGKFTAKCSLIQVDKFLEDRSQNVSSINLFNEYLVTI